MCLNLCVNPCALHGWTFCLSPELMVYISHRTFLYRTQSNDFKTYPPDSILYEILSQKEDDRRDYVDSYFTENRDHTCSNLANWLVSVVRCFRKEITVTDLALTIIAIVQYVAVRRQVLLSHWWDEGNRKGHCRSICERAGPGMLGLSS